MLNLHMEHATKKIVLWVWQIIIILFVTTSAACLFVGMLYLLLPRDVSMTISTDLRERFKIWHYGEIPDSPVAVTNAERDHAAIVDWVNGCLGAPERENIPASVQMLMSGRFKGATGSGRGSNLIAVPSFYIRTLQLSHYILDERVASEEELSHSYSLAQSIAIFSILISAATTILVGLSATEIGKQEGRLGKSIRVWVLIFPVLGTSISALAAFYDPNGALIRKNQTATAFRQLHFQISFAIPKMSCIKNDQEPKDATAMLDAWTQRLQELAATTSDSRAAAARAPSSSGSSSSSAAGGGAK